MADNKEPFIPFHKSESSPKTKTPNVTEKGQPGIASISRFIDDLSRSELKLPQRFCTIDQMCQDSAVSNSIRFRTDLVVQAMVEGSVKSKGSSKSDIATDLITYCFNNMSSGSWWQAMRDAATHIKYGFSLLNIVIEPRYVSKYKGTIYTLKKLAPRSQKSVYGWVWDDNYRELKGFVQKPMLLKNRSKSLVGYEQYIPSSQVSSGYYKDSKYPFFRTNEFLLFSYNSTNNNPQGDLLVSGCFSAFLEKKVIEQYQLSGVAKDLGGIIVARSPSDLFEKANDPDNPNYAEAFAAKAEFEEDIANMHASKTTFVHLQSDRDERGNYLYDFELKGVDGGAGKAYNTTEIIKEYNKAIYNSFGTQFMLLGQDGGGSYALSKDQMTAFQYYVQRDMSEMADVINTQLIPRILAANDIYLDYEDMPEFVPLNPFKVTYDEAGKFIQRVSSVNKNFPALYKFLLEDLGAPIDGVDDLDFSDKGASRAADGMSKGSGNGTSDNVAGGDNAVSNTEGGGVSKSMHVDGDKIIVNGSVINSQELNENGEYK